jgi:hypothetical protein
MNLFKILPIFVIVILSFAGCKKKDTFEPKLIIKLTVDSTQIRLGNLGNPVNIPAGNAGQHPKFNSIAAHYLELAQTALTPLGGGEILYHAAETTTGGNRAIDFSKSIVKRPGETYLEIPLKDIAAGNYEWVRLSLSYQNADILLYYAGQPYTGTVAGFVGYNTYISNYLVKTQSDVVNANKLQGYWAFETITTGLIRGQNPGTTVPNPLFATSPIPAGSCVVTGQFSSPLNITGDETSNITVEMSLSINNSFEWVDVNGNGKFDVDPGSGENVVDMGLRGLIPKIVQ